MDAAEKLPIPIWEKILKYSNLSARDILAVCATCERLHNIFQGRSSLWRTKVADRWPCIWKQLERDPFVDWHDIYQQRYLTVSATKKCLDDISARYMRQESMYLSYSAFSPMINCLRRFQKGELFLIDELRCILNETPKNTRLTDKYYALSAVRFIVQENLTSFWRLWLEGGQLLEIGAWLFAKWFQPVSYLDDTMLQRELDQLVDETKSKLHETNKRHPLLNYSSSIDHMRLRETMWSVTEAREIIDGLNFVFSTLRGYRGNTDDYYNTKNSFLNEVMSTRMGIPITMCILYHAVARRLGVFCAPVNFPGHFLLKFLEHPDLRESEKYTYIDVFHSCRLMREDQVWSMHGSAELTREGSFEVANPVAVIIRMLHNVAHIHERYRPTDALVICSAWELGVVLKPMEFDVRFALARTYSHLDINIDKIVSLMQEIPEPTDQVRRAQRQHYIEMARATMVNAAISDMETKPPQPKLRSKYPHVKHSVGTIMHHRLYNYTCIITGWDPECTAADSWKLQMGVQNLPRQDKQPFYHVLVNDGTNRYAAEENIVFEPNPVPVSHPEVGKYFDEYTGQFYKMNQERKRDYPDDDKAAVKYAEDSYESKQNVWTE